MQCRKLITIIVEVLSLLEERHGNGQDELGPVPPSEDGSPGVLHALQSLVGQHNGVKLHINILGATNLL